MVRGPPAPARTNARWTSVTRRRRGQSASGPSKRHEQILSNETLETQVQNEMSPFPATYLGHVSRREIPASIEAHYDPHYSIPSLRDMCLRRAAQHFSTHILPAKSPPKESRRRAHRPLTRDKDEYVPDDMDLGQPSVTSDGVITSPRLGRREAEMYKELNHDLLLELPSILLERLYELVCEYAPHSLTKDVVSTYFVPYPGTGTQPARLRRRLFFPASLPLFSDDPKCAPLLLATLGGALALSKDAPQVVEYLREIDLHGLTRLSASALTRFLLAPPAPRAWHLTRVSVPGCLGINDATISTLVQVSGPTLEAVDLRMTSVSARVLSTLGEGCVRLSALRVAWCEQFTDEAVSDAVSLCIAQCSDARPPRIPFSELRVLDVSHTLIGDVGVGSLSRVTGHRLTSLDLGYTRVAEGGSLDVLSMALGLGRAARGSATPLTHLSLAGLCVHGTSLVHFLHHWLPWPGEALSQDCTLASLQLDDLLEYSRREASALQGRRGLSGDVLHVIASMVATASAQTPFELVSINGDKRGAAVPSHWAWPAAERSVFEPYVLGDTLYLLMSCVRRVYLNGLEVQVKHLPPLQVHSPLPGKAQRCLTELRLASTALTDAALETLVPWTGALSACYLDDTLITSSSLDALVDANPRLQLISVAHCRGVPVRARRAYFT